MTTVQRVAQIFGWIFIIIGVWGYFLPGGLTMVSDLESAPHLLGLFPVNVLHNTAHLLLGIWGVIASRSFGAAKTYAIVSGLAYLLLAFAALLSPTLFGLMPIGEADVWLHVFLALVLLGFGVMAKPDRVVVDTAPPAA